MPKDIESYYCFDNVEDIEFLGTDTEIVVWAEYCENEPQCLPRE